MEISSDILLRGSYWSRAIEKLANIFKTRTNYSVFLLSLSLGIMYDQRIDKFDNDSDDVRSVPRNVLQNQDNGKLDIIFQSAILSTRTESLSEKERLELAFGEKSDFNKLQFLTQFANFGVKVLNERLEDTDLETMESLKNFLISCVEGRNIEIDGIPDDVLLDEG